MYKTQEQYKRDIVEVGKQLYDKGLLVGTDGNISIRTGENEVLITASGFCKGKLETKHITKVDMDGNVLNGLKPARDIRMHLAAYRERPDIKAVVHAHPPVATSYAITGEWLDQPIFAESIIQLGVVPVAEYATPGTQEVPDSVAPFCRDYNCCLLAAHGALTWGADLMQAYYRMEALEHFARIHTEVIGHQKPAQMLTEAQVDKLLAIRAGCNNGSPAGGVPANRG